MELRLGRIGGWNGLERVPGMKRTIITSLATRRSVRGGLVVLAVGAAMIVPIGSASAATVVSAVAPSTDIAGGDGQAMSVVGGAIELAVPACGADRTVLTFSTTDIHRHGWKADLAIIGTGSPNPATVVTTRMDVMETARTATAGVEQSWLFPRPPHGSGDLVVQVSVRASAQRVDTVTVSTAGGVQTGATADGVTLRYPNLAEAVYHNGSWIDASGRQWPIAARVVNGAVELTVPAGVLAASTFPAILDPQIIVTPIT